MRLRLTVLLTCAVSAPLAVAQSAGDTQQSGPSFYQILASIPLGPIFIVVVIYLGLFKLVSRWPQFERWIVGASLLALPPLATYGIRGFIHTGSNSPVRDTGIFWAVIALALALAWWLLKTRTRLLESPQEPVSYEATRPLATMAKEAAAPTAAPASQRRDPAPSPTPASSAPPREDRPASKPAEAKREAIFISYRRQDSADVTGRIYDRLVQRYSREQIFKDVDSIPLGVDFRQHLGNVVGRCSLLLAVIGPQWSSAAGPNGRRLDDKSDFVRIEIEAALARNIPVIPLLVGGAALPAEAELPASLGAITYRNGIPVRPDPDFHRDMDRLITGMEQHGQA